MTTKPITKTQAEALWEQLHEDFANAEERMKQIIITKAWEPLGYRSFHEAWAERMSDISIAAEVRPHVVYQMLNEGMTPEDIDDAVKGIGADIAESLQRQRDNGVPAELATLIGKRSKQPLPDSIRIKLGYDRLKRYKHISQQAGMKVQDIAFQATVARFEELGAGWLRDDQTA